MEQKQLPSEIYKAHQEIAVMPVPGSRITLLMRRFFNILLQHAQTIGQAETYRVPLDEILSGADFNSPSYLVAKNALCGMAKTAVEWSVIRDDGDGGEGMVVSKLLAEAEIIEQNRRLYLEWSFSPKIRQRLRDPNLYMLLSSSLRSGTAASLYAVCIRYLTNVDGLTNKAEWTWWRHRLTGIHAGDESQSSAYKYFKRDTLMPAIREINDLTEIEVKLHEFKTGRKITHIQFASTKKAQENLDVDFTKPIFDEALLGKILAFGVTDSEAAKIYGTRDEATIRASIEYVENMVRKGGVDSAADLFCNSVKKTREKAPRE